MATIKTIGAKLFARYIKKQTDTWAFSPEKTQERVFKHLIKQAKTTRFGKDHGFDRITSVSDFQARVPVRDYEGLRPYVDAMVAGQADILWKGKPLYFAKTSGTTSGAKYIPITKESIGYHISAARNAILLYIAETGKADFVDGKMIFLQGSPLLEKLNGVQLGRLSGIAAHYVPSYLQKNRLPSWQTNCIEDWETKVNAVVEETYNQDMRVISGIPSWVQMYFERLQQKSGKLVGELFPNFSLFIYGGVNYAPYKAKFEAMIGRSVPAIELYPASEGFFAFQDSQKEQGMLLQLNSGIFYEFIKVSEFFDANPKRHTITEVSIGENYVMLISTNAGLWAYNIGDTVQFTSIKPYRVVVSGRIKHFISAFGEHVIGKEVETALSQALSVFSEVQVNEFTVAPEVNPEEGLPYHEWFVSFANPPKDKVAFAKAIDVALQKQNTYYKDLIQGGVLQPLQLRSVKETAFTDYMKSIGKLGGQNKIQRLSNDRKLADFLQAYINEL